jgi:hypothetical protein
MSGIEKLLESPYTALAVAVVLGALALSGKFNVTATQFLLVFAWAITTLGLRGQALPIMIGSSAVVAGALVLLGYYFRPDAVPSYYGVLEAQGTTLFSSKEVTRTIQFGQTGFKIAMQGPQDSPIFNFFNESNLMVEEVGGKLKVSTQIRDPSGEIVAELIRNEWRVSPPKIWDRNYNDDTLEVKAASGRIVLQVRVLPDLIQISGEWWSKNGEGIRIATSNDAKFGVSTVFQPLRRGNNPNEPRILPIFAYPSETHLGELRSN